VHSLFIRNGKYLSAPATKVYLALASYADAEGFCWPSIEALVERSGYKKRAVIEALKELKFFDYIAWETKKAWWSSNYKKYVTKNFYTLLPPPMQVRPTKTEAVSYRSLYKKKNSGVNGFGKQKQEKQVADGSLFDPMILENLRHRLTRKCTRAHPN
jgi:hypothetical protein